MELQLRHTDDDELRDPHPGLDDERLLAVGVQQDDPHLAASRDGFAARHGASIWEEDFSAVKAAIDDLKRSGVQDLRQYLQASPQFIDHAISLVRIVDVKPALVRVQGGGRGL